VGQQKEGRSSGQRIHRSDIVAETDVVIYAMPRQLFDLMPELNEARRHHRKFTANRDLVRKERIAASCPLKVGVIRSRLANAGAGSSPPHSSPIRSPARSPVGSPAGSPTGDLGIQPEITINMQLEAKELFALHHSPARDAPPPAVGLEELIHRPGSPGHSPRTLTWVAAPRHSTLGTLSRPSTSGATLIPSTTASTLPAVNDGTATFHDPGAPSEAPPQCPEVEAELVAAARELLAEAKHEEELAAARKALKAAQDGQLQAAELEAARQKLNAKSSAPSGSLPSAVPSTTPSGPSRRPSTSHLPQRPSTSHSSASCPPGMGRGPMSMQRNLPARPSTSHATGLSAERARNKGPHNSSSRGSTPLLPPDIRLKNHPAYKLRPLPEKATRKGWDFPPHTRAAIGPSISLQGRSGPRGSKRSSEIRAFIDSLEEHALWEPPVVRRQRSLMSVHMAEESARSERERATGQQVPQSAMMRPETSTRSSKSRVIPSVDEDLLFGGPSNYQLKVTDEGSLQLAAKYTRQPLRIGPKMTPLLPAADNRTKNVKGRKQSYT